MPLSLYGSRSRHITSELAKLIASITAHLKRPYERQDSFFGCVAGNGANNFGTRYGQALSQAAASSTAGLNSAAQAVAQSAAGKLLCIRGLQT